MILACDEAGRGCLIGPMVLAGVIFHEESLGKLRQIGVKDSKKLTSRMREKLYRPIRGLADSVYVTRVQPRVIDSYVADSTPRRKNLNTLEAEVLAKIVARSRTRVAFIDCPDPVPDRFASVISRMAECPTVVVCEHKADERRVEVAASSIIAKVTRDRTVARLRMKWGDFGSGYPSDPKTRAFLKDIVTGGERPDIIRWSWKTAKHALSGFQPSN